MSPRIQSHPNSPIFVRGGRKVDSVIPATVNSTPAFNSYSVLFDGVNDEVSVGSAMQADYNVAFSVSAWIYPTTVAAFPIVYGFQQGVNFPGTAFGINSNQGNVMFLQMVAFADTTKQIFVKGSTALTANHWYHVAVTYTGSGSAANVQIYVNGVAETMTIITNTLASTILSGSTTFLGTDGVGDFMTGNIDEFTYWNAALTQAQVTALYNSGKPNDPTTNTAAANLVNWWRMGDGDTYPTLLDNKGTANGTMTNMVAGDIQAFTP